MAHKLAHIKSVQQLRQIHSRRQPHHVPCAHVTAPPPPRQLVSRPDGRRCRTPSRSRRCSVSRPVLLSSARAPPLRCPHATQTQQAAPVPLLLAYPAAACCSFGRFSDGILVDGIWRGRARDLRGRGIWRVYFAAIPRRSSARAQGICEPSTESYIGAGSRRLAWELEPVPSPNETPTGFSFFIYSAPRRTKLHTWLQKDDPRRSFVRALRYARMIAHPILLVLYGVPPVALSCTPPTALICPCRRLIRRRGRRAGGQPGPGRRYLDLLGLAGSIPSATGAGTTLSRI